MCDTVQNNYSKLQPLADAFAKELCETVSADYRFIDTVMDIVAEFVEKEFPFIDEDNRYELGLMMLDKTAFVKY